MRIKFPVLMDVFITSHPDHIRWLNAHPDVVRPLDGRAGLLQRFINGRTLRDLRFNTEVLPVFRPKDDLGRARRQAELADALDEPDRVVASDTDWLGRYVAGYVPRESNEREPTGAAPDALVGVYVQQWCGRLFNPRYRASQTTYTAGRLVAEWPSLPPWRTWRRSARRDLQQARRELAQAAAHEIHCVHATSIGMENITRSIRSMRALVGRVGVRNRSPEEAMRQCLFVPRVLLRGCERELHAPFLRKPLQRKTVVLFLLARAYGKSGDLGLAFLDDTWSACPARHVVPEMLRSVWRAAVEVETQENAGWEKVHHATRVARKLLRVVGHG